MPFIPAFISMPGGSEWIVIFLVILVIFGPKSLPKIGKAIGQGIREFKDASDGIKKTIEEEVSAVEREESTPKADQEASQAAEVVETKDVAAETVEATAQPEYEAAYAPAEPHRD